MTRNYLNDEYFKQLKEDIESLPNDLAEENRLKEIEFYEKKKQNEKIEEFERNEK